MGCEDTKDKLEEKMMLIKIDRMEVRMEREKQLKKLAAIEGHEIKKKQIPDYIDPTFAKEKGIYEEKENSDVCKTKKEKKKEKPKNKIK